LLPLVGGAALVVERMGEKLRPIFALPSLNDEVLEDSEKIFMGRESVGQLARRVFIHSGYRWLRR